MRRSLIAFVACVTCNAVAAEPPARLTIDAAVATALAHHPRLQVRAAALEASRAAVEVARAGYLPDVTLDGQLDVGTGNVLRGSLFPMRGIPSVSGPPTARSLGDASAGSLVGAGGAWDVVGLARRIATVDAALADEDRARAGTGVERLAVAYAAADQFLDVITRRETVRAATAAVERARVFETTVKALVAQDLRPGADASRAAAERAVAETQLVRAEEAEAVSRAALARALGEAGHAVEVDAQDLAAPPPPAPATAGKRHPLLLEADAAVRAAEARRRALALGYLPRLELVAALWVRGSGLSSGAVAPSPAAGLVPDTPNWATGVVFTWPLLDLVAVHARVRRETAQVALEDARRRDLAEAIQAQLDEARAILDAARREAANTPVALDAARAADQQARARYDAGLATAVDVAEADRLLAQAEIDDAVARLGVRRAELLLTRAAGDITPFLDGIRQGAR